MACLRLARWRHYAAVACGAANAGATDDDDDDDDDAAAAAAAAAATDDDDDADGAGDEESTTPCAAAEGPAFEMLRRLLGLLKSGVAELREGAVLALGAALHHSLFEALLTHGQLLRPLTAEAFSTGDGGHGAGAGAALGSTPVRRGSALLGAAKRGLTAVVGKVRGTATTD